MRTKRVKGHKVNDSKGLKGLNIGLTYILVGRDGQECGNGNKECWGRVEMKLKELVWKADNFRLWNEIK